MAGILIGIPRKPDRDTRDFDESLSHFIEEIKGEHEVDVYEFSYGRVDVAREKVVDFFLKTGFGFLLFLDDDHTGHSKGMLDALLKPDAYVCAMKCYSRYFPHFCTLMDKHIKRRNGYDQVSKFSGYQPCEFVGFGMTLIKRETFFKIDSPYFVASEDNDKEDTYFCSKLEDAGIIPIGCFEYTLTHDGINEETVETYRQKNGIEFIKRKQIEQNKKAFEEAVKREEIKCKDFQVQLM